jgi:RNA polymerase sigma factor (sigma-70 family)
MCPEELRGVDVQRQPAPGRHRAALAPTSGTADTKLLVRAAARGDQEAWNRLVDRYNGLLWAIARAHRLDGAEAADVVQGTWLRLIEHLETIRTPEGVGSWLATTARRECLRTIRRTARIQPSDRMESLSPVDPSEIDGGLLDAERDACLWRAFRHLPQRDQQLLRLLTADPAPSYEEIGSALGMPIGSIGPTRARALGRLRRELESAEALGALAERGWP